MKKILQLIPRLVTGGAEVLASEYYIRLNGENFTVYMAGVVADGALKARLIDQSRVWANNGKGGRLARWRRLERWVKKLKPDLIHSHLLSSDFFAWRYKKRVNPAVRWVSTLHNTEYHAPRWRRALWRAILPQANRLIAVSPTVLDYSTKFLGAPPSATVVLPNGISLEPWLTISTADLLTCPELRLVTIGRLEEQKGHCFLFQALANLQNIPWKLTVYGEGSLAAALRRQAKSLRIDQRVSWLGIANDIPKRLAEYDIVVQPSRWEGMSLVIMEAMAAARVVVASRPAAATLITDKKNGFVIPAEDSAAISDALRTIHANRGAAHAAALAARRHAIDHFSLSTHLQRLTALYNEPF